MPDLGFTFQHVKLAQSTAPDDHAELSAEFERLGVCDSQGRMTAEATRGWFAYLDRLETQRQDAAARRLGYRDMGDLLAQMGRNHGLFRDYLRVVT